MPYKLEDLKVGGTVTIKIIIREPKDRDPFCIGMGRSGQIYRVNEEEGEFEGLGIPTDFWTHYSKITGRVVEESERDNFFSCSC